MILAFVEVVMKLRVAHFEEEEEKFGRKNPITDPLGFEDEVERSITTILEDPDGTVQVQDIDVSIERTVKDGK